MKTLSENFGGADDDHVLIEVFLPQLLTPEVAAHLSTEHVHRLVEIGLEDCMLLKDQGYRINLLPLALYELKKDQHSLRERMRSALACLRPYPPIPGQICDAAEEQQSMFYPNLQDVSGWNTTSGRNTDLCPEQQ